VVRMVRFCLAVRNVPGASARDSTICGELRTEQGESRG
jgi:hypothetical protein